MTKFKREHAGLDKPKESILNESGDRLINPRIILKNTLIDINPKMSEYEHLPTDVCYLREDTVKALAEAENLLPDGCRLLIYEGYRSLMVQKLMFETYRDNLRRSHLDWDEERLTTETSKFISPLTRVPDHSRGIAVDITIIGLDGKQIDMGSALHEFSELSVTNTGGLSILQSRNRSMLIKIMTEAGFKNYPNEWWHWKLITNK